MPSSTPQPPAITPGRSRLNPSRRAVSSRAAATTASGARQRGREALPLLPNLPSANPEDFTFLKPLGTTPESTCWGHRHTASGRAQDHNGSTGQLQLAAGTASNPAPDLGYLLPSLRPKQGCENCSVPPPLPSAAPREAGSPGRLAGPRCPQRSPLPARTGTGRRGPEPPPAPSPAAAGSFPRPKRPLRCLRAAPGEVSRKARGAAGTCPASQKSPAQPIPAPPRRSAGPLAGWGGGFGIVKRNQPSCCTRPCALDPRNPQGRARPPLAFQGIQVSRPP